MNNPFINKVTAERKVLAIVNVHTPGNHQLTGLTAIAIIAWSRNVSFSHIEKITECLRILGQLCQRLSDRSQESFDTLDPSIMAKVDEELILLNALFSNRKP